MVGKILEYEAKTIRNAGLEQGKTEGRREGRCEGRREGKQEGRMELLFELVQNGLLSVKDAAVQLNLSEEMFIKKMQNYKISLSH